MCFVAQMIAHPLAKAATAEVEVAALAKAWMPKAQTMFVSWASACAVN
jgi:hypothetical protein